MICLLYICKIMRIFLLLFAFICSLLYSSDLYSQQQTEEKFGFEKNVYGETQVNELLKYRKHWNDSLKTTPGYRVQIFSASGPLSKTNALDEKAKFSELFGDIPAYLMAQMPYFKIRVGDFTERIDAAKFHHEIKNIYPSSFVVPDDVYFK